MADIKGIRLEMLGVLLAQHDNNQAALARALKKKPALISQWFHGRRTISEESARDIEKQADKPLGWMDGLAEAPALLEAVTVHEAMNALGAEARKETLDFLRYKLERAKQHHLAERISGLLLDIDIEDGEPKDPPPATGH